jgi:hypothetical protein
VIETAVLRLLKLGIGLEPREIRLIKNLEMENVIYSLYPTSAPLIHNYIGPPPETILKLCSHLPIQLAPPSLVNNKRFLLMN